MQLQLMHKAVQIILKLGGRAIKNILADVRVDDNPNPKQRQKRTEEQEWVVAPTNKTASILISLARRRSC